MTVSELIKKLQQYQKMYPDIEVYVTDSQGDDSPIYDIFYTNYNNYGGEEVIILDNGENWREYSDYTFSTKQNQYGGKEMILIEN